MKNFEEVAEVELVKIGDRMLPSVSLGTSPFIGAGQFRQSYDYYQRFMNHPEKMIEIILRAIQLGIPSVQVLAYEPIVSALLEAEKISQVKLAKTTIIGLVDWKRELALSILLDPIIVFIHAQIADSRDISLIEQIIKRIKDEGIIPGCATHNPVTTLPLLDKAGIDLLVWLVPVNKIGYLMGSEPVKVLEVIDQTEKIVLAKKVLGAGRIPPDEALSYITTIPKIKGIVVGIASKCEAEETFLLTKRYWRRNI